MRGGGRSCSTTTGRSASSRSTPISRSRRPRSARCSDRSRRFPRPTCTSSAAGGAANLEQWFARIPIHLCAEHGYLARAPGEEWRTLVDLDLTWLRPIERLLRRVAADVPGAHVERKSCSVAWHYRQAEPEYGSWRARELLNDLHQHLAGAPAEILVGHQVVEVRALGVDKGVYVRSLFPDGKESTHFVLGLGDDRTDHDLLDALPSGSVAGHVGGLLPSTRSANGRREDVHLVGPGEVRAFLGALVASVDECARDGCVARSSRTVRRSAKLHHRHAVKAKNAADMRIASGVPKIRSVTR